MAADRPDDRDSGLDQSMSPRYSTWPTRAMDVVVGVDHLVDAPGQRFHVAPGHAAVGVQPFERHEQRAGPPGQLRDHAGPGSHRC